jgi:hypothetical protein
MAVTPVATLPAWSLQALDTQQVGRFHDNAWLSQLSGTPNNITRAGVIPSIMQGGNAVPIDLFVSATGSGLGIQINAGNAVIAGSGAPTSLRGPYLASSVSVVTRTLDPANATNARIDLVYYQVIDGTPGAGDAGTTGAYLGVVTGTPSGSPAVPALPTVGVCIPLCQILVAANATTSSGLTFTDVRKSAGPSPRFLLPGDALSDPAYRYGEQRQRRLGTYALSAGADPIVTDTYGFDNAWHGTKPLPLPAGQIAVTSTNWSFNVEAKTWTLTIPDPGWAYYINLSASAFRQFPSGSVYAQLFCHLTSAITGTTMREFTADSNSAGLTAAINGEIWNGALGTPFTGATSICVGNNTGITTGSLGMLSMWCSATVMPV